MADSYAIEICGPNNDSVLFSPTRAKVRGRWDQSNVAHKDKSDPLKAIALAAPSIPGRVIQLDAKAKIGRILDPLTESPDGKAILAKVQQVYEAHKSFFGEKPLGHPKEETVLTIDDVKTWAFYMRQLIDIGMARTMPGSSPLPDADEIRKWPGRRVRDPLCDLAQTAKSAEEAENKNLLYKYADEVPVGKPVAAAAGA